LKSAVSLTASTEKITGIAFSGIQVRNARACGFFMKQKRKKSAFAAKTGIFSGAEGKSAEVGIL
jgi:hypothetical protein